MQTSWNENQALLCGRVREAPAFSHKNHEEPYHVFSLSVARLSGVEDHINVVAPARLLAGVCAAPGVCLEIGGQVRSFNNRSSQGSRLVIVLFAQHIAPAQSEPVNELKLAGVLCKPPVLRRTPLGREICDLMLAVNRRYGRADYLPCIVWGTLAESCAALTVGDGVRLSGRLQSRNYVKVIGGESQQRTAFEISVMRLEPISCR